MKALIHDIMLSEISQRKTSCDLTYMWSLKNKTNQQKPRKRLIKLVVARGKGSWENV